MEKTFALGISGMFATLTTGVFSAPSLFATADALSFLGLAERLGLGVVMAILGYKIIIKIIEVFGPPLLARLNTHDADVKDRLADILLEVRKTSEPQSLDCGNPAQSTDCGSACPTAASPPTPPKAH
jgi:hypothetical protein